jgi:hypothetical protein
MLVHLTKEGRSKVYNFGNEDSRTITLTKDKYGSGAGTGTLQIRGRDTAFTQDAAAPDWENYTIPVQKTWQFIQVRATKP